VLQGGCGLLTLPLHREEPDRAGQEGDREVSPPGPVQDGVVTILDQSKMDYTHSPGPVQNGLVTILLGQPKMYHSHYRPVQNVFIMPGPVQKCMNLFWTRLRWTARCTPGPILNVSFQSNQSSIYWSHLNQLEKGVTVTSGPFQ